MKVDVPIGISARHVHLNEETYKKLFDEDLTKKNDLNQIGQYAANETVKIKTAKGSFENVRIIGPLREYNQVEISKSDAYKLGLNPPVRKSGDVVGSEKIIIETKKACLEIEACIIANRHVHMNQDKANELGLYDNEIVQLKIDGQKGGIIDVAIKISDDGYFEAHLDIDDANAFLLENGAIETLII